MQTPIRITSIAAAGPSIGREAAMHVDLLWRDMMKAQGSTEGPTFFRVITGEEHPLGNLAILRESSDVSVIERAITPLMDISQPTAVLFVAGVDDDISGLLTSRGFLKIEAMPAMAVDVPSLAPTKLPEGYDFFKVSSAEEGTEWTDVVAAGFEIPRGLARLLSPEVHGVSTEPDAQVQFFCIRKGGRIVATSMVYLASGLAGVYCVATLPEERGKGLGAHVTAQALRVANQVGYGVGVLQSSVPGHNVYLSLGFRDVESVPMFVRMPNTSGPSDAESNAA